MKLIMSASQNAVHILNVVSTVMCTKYGKFAPSHLLSDWVEPSTTTCRLAVAF